MNALALGHDQVAEVRAERDMVAALERHFIGRSCLREFNTGHGRADLLVAEVDYVACAERSAVGLQPLDDEALLYLLDVLPMSPTTVQELADVRGMSISYVRRLLGRLISAGFVKRSAHGYARICTPPTVLTGIVAIEAKMRNWQAGLFQCRRYMRYSNAVYLALFSPSLVRVDLSIVTQAGVGLLSIDPTGTVREVLEPAVHEPADRAIRTLANEAIWRQLTAG